MGILDLMKRAEEEPKSDEITADDILIGSAPANTYVGRSEAMAIPAFAACVDTISGIAASIPIKLYRRIDGQIEEVEDDSRVGLLNGDTGDTLTAVEMKKAMFEDYYCSDKGGNAFINRNGNRIVSIHYVKSEDISPLKNVDPIFKEVQYIVNGQRFDPWQFVRILHSTRDGRTGRSVISSNMDALSVAYQTMKYEQSLVARGGNKRGFLTAQRKLVKKAMQTLKDAWRRFYGTTDENVIVLNDGTTFQEASSTSVEMQLNENKQTNSEDIYSMFKMPPSIVRGGIKSGTATKDDRDNFIRYCLIPLIAEARAALNRSLLLESEKPAYFFDFDLTEFAKANEKERWEAWKIAKDGGFVMVDEVRKKENMPPLGLDFISMGLQDVLFDTETRKIIIPNMGKAIDIDNLPAEVEEEKQPTQLEGGENFGDKAEK